MRSQITLLVKDGDEQRRQHIAKSICREDDFRLIESPAGDVDAVLLVQPPATGELAALATTCVGACAPVIVVALAPESSRDAHAFIRAGADDIVWLPIRIDEVVLRLRTWVGKRRVEEQARRLRETITQKGPGDLVGQSVPMRRMFQLIERVARSDASVLIVGETGTGKELVARAVHTESNKPSGPFVACNLSALPKDLVESELFGHAAGAFTDAKTMREGKIEKARGGTLFLDEIGDLPLPIQVKLLRVLQERVYERLGEDSVRDADFRLICATHGDLELLVEQGRFREDLFYRINVIRIDVPTLRERGEDILVLASHFLARTAAQHGVSVTMSQEAKRALERHQWPGNVRELQHTIERAVALSEDGDEIGGDLIQMRKRRGPSASLATQILADARGLDETLAEIEREILVIILQRCNGNQSQAAEALKLPRQTLQSRLKKYGLP